VNSFFLTVHVRLGGEWMPLLTRYTVGVVLAFLVRLAYFMLTCCPCATSAKEEQIRNPQSEFPNRSVFRCISNLTLS
jgi:Na+-transporting methylmalonyl-CoA/oxaloacetate decarboxylase gamma subunit